MKLKLCRMLVVTGVLFSQAYAEVNPQTQRDVSLIEAHGMVLKAIKHCSKLGHHVSVTVVDSSGVIKAMARADGSGVHTPEASRRKAYTSASARNRTSAMLLASQTNPLAQNLGEINDFLLLGGGVPIQVNGMTIGGIGVGGAPNGNIDEECALAGLTH